MEPELGSYQRSKRPTIVLFPEPLGPTNAVTRLAGKVKLKLSRTFTSGRVGYEKSTFEKLILPEMDAGNAPDTLIESMFEVRSIVLNRLSAAEAALVKAVRCGASWVIADAAMITENNTLGIQLAECTLKTDISNLHYYGARIFDLS